MKAEKNIPAKLVNEKDVMFSANTVVQAVMMITQRQITGTVIHRLNKDRCGEWHRVYESAKDGAEFGYNKANEWHYVKGGDLPNAETKDYTYIRRRKRYERQFTDYRVIKCFVLCQNEKGKITAEVGYFDCNQKCFLNNAEGVVIAWKEIVLPELKESE